MFYRGLKLLMKLVLRIFFRKIYFSGASRIPTGQPVILACNHPNSFLDAVLLAVLVPRPLHFLARGDVFNSPVKRWLLTRLHLIPVYRLEEGAAHLQRNTETFARCYKILKEKGVILVFSEGVCVLEKRLRPLRKGTARLAFGAEESCGFHLNLQVVPVGLNYTYASEFRREVMIGVGEPIALQRWQALYRSHPAKAFRAFNEVLRRELENNIISIPLPGQEVLAEAGFRLSRAGNPDFLSPTWLSPSRRQLEAEQHIAGQFAVTGPQLQDGAEPVGQALPQQDLLWFSRRRLLLGLPFALLGLVLNGIPGYGAVLVTRKKVARQEFYASVLMVAGMVLYLCYWLMVALGASLLWGWRGLVTSLAVPLFGYVALLWLDQCRLWELRAQTPELLRRHPVKAQGFQQPIG